jgi:hypothetical protein
MAERIGPLHFVPMRYELPGLRFYHTPTRPELFKLLTELKPEQKLERDQCLNILQIFEKQIVGGLCNTTEDKDYVRWLYVCKAFDVGKCKTWDEAYEYASEELRGHRAFAGKDMIEKAYKTEQKRRPPDMRYRRRRLG